MQLVKISLSALLLLSLSTLWAQTEDQLLLKAVKNNDLAAVQAALDAGASVYATDEHGATPVLWAVYQADLPIVKLLVEQGANLQPKGVIYLDRERTAYYSSLTGAAAGKGRIEILRYLIENTDLEVDQRAYDPEIGQYTGWTALQWACNNGKLEPVIYLLEKGADLQVDEGSLLVLSSPHPLVFETIVDLGIKVNQQQVFEATLNALDNKQDTTIQLLLEKNQLPEKEKALALIVTAVTGDVPSFHLLYTMGQADTSYVYEGKSVRGWAIKHNSKFILWYLNHLRKGKAFVDWTKQNRLLLKYYQQGQYQQAISIGENLKSFTEQYIGQKNNYFSASLNNLAGLYRALGRYSKAEPLYKEALQVIAGQLGSNHPDYAKSLNKLATLYLDQGRYSEAEPLFKEALQIIADQLGNNHPEYAKSLNKLAALYKLQGRLPEAESLYELSLKIKNEILGKKRLNYSTSLNNLAQLHGEKRTYNEARQLYKEAASIRKRVLKTPHTDYANTLNNLGALYRTQGRFEEARFLYEEAASISKQVLSTLYIDRDITFNNLVSLYRAQGGYEKARSLLDEARKLYVTAMALEKKRGILKGKTLALHNNPKHDSTLIEIERLYEQYLKVQLSYEKAISRQRNLTNFYNPRSLFRTIELHEKAESMQLEGLEIRKKSLSKSLADYVTSITNLAQLYRIKGQYREAEALYDKALKITGKKLGQRHPNYAVSLNNLADHYFYMGAYEGAKQLYLEVLEIRGELLGKSHPDYATSLNSLAELYKKQGQYVAAEPLYLEALETKAKVLGISHPDYAVTMNGLAELKLTQGEYTKSKALYETVLNIRSAALGKSHPDYAASLSNLAYLNFVQGRYEEAEKLYTEALDILGKRPCHPLYANVLEQRNKVFDTQERFDEVEQAWKAIIKACEDCLGKNHLDSGLSNQKLAQFYYQQGQYDKAANHVEEALRVQVRKLITNVSTIEERAMKEYLDAIKTTFNLQVSIAIADPEPEVLKSVYKVSLLQNRFLLTTGVSAKHLVLATKDSLIKQNYEDLQRKKLDLEGVLSQPIANRFQVDELEEEVRQLERSLYQKLPELKRRLVDLQTTWEQVQHMLHLDEVAIEFIHYQRYDKQGPTQTTEYAALLIGADYSHPEIVALGSEKELGLDSGSDFLLSSDIYNPQPLTSVNMPRPQQNSSPNSKTDRAFTVTQKKGGALTDPVPTRAYFKPSKYKKLWHPLDSLISDAKVIYYAPSKGLSRIAFAALYDEQREQFLSERFQLHQLGTTRQLVSGLGKLKAPQKGCWLLAGGINYQCADSTKNTDCGDRLPPAIPDDLSVTKNFLPGTFREVDSTSTLLAEKGIEHRCLWGSLASEPLFSIQGQKAPSPPVFHIGTHGFYNNRDLESKSPFRFSSSPMTRTGLMLAGSAKHLDSEVTLNTLEDGIWTASEISKMNLSNTKLAVLSACETGLGSIIGSEGVYGLQRAFKMAGVDKLMVSLWPVDDTATQNFMVCFYGHWLEGKTAYEAYRAAQEEIRKTYPDPKYWAAFVLIE